MISQLETFTNEERELVIKLKGVFHFLSHLDEFGEESPDVREVIEFYPGVKHVTKAFVKFWNQPNQVTKEHLLYLLKEMTGEWV